MLYSSLSKSIVFLLIFLGASKLTANFTPLAWNIPAPNPHFHGREEILGSIERIFQSGQKQVLSLSGPPSFGKTQIAKQYAHLHKNAYDIVWQFYANQPLEPQFRPLAAFTLKGRDLNSMQTARLLRVFSKNLEKKKLRCLFIFDDVQRREDLHIYFPLFSLNNVDILITTKNKNISEKTLSVKKFKAHESIDYIKKFLPQESIGSAKELADYFGGSPSALAIATDYIKNYPGMTVQAYLSKHKKSKKAIPPPLQASIQKLDSPIDGYAVDLAATIGLSLKDLQQRSGLAYDLLCYIALFDPSKINFEYVLSWLKHRKSKEDILDLLNLINQYSFIEVTQNVHSKGVYISMHQLIQKIINSLTPTEEKKKLIDEAISKLSPTFSSRSDKVIEKILEDDQPLLHALRVFREARNFQYDTPDLVSLKVRALDVACSGLRDFEKAKTLMPQIEQALKSGVRIPEKNRVLYEINASIVSSMYSPDYEKAISHIGQAKKHLGKMKDMNEEKIRVIANMIQLHSLNGEIDLCKTLVKEGSALLYKSQSSAYNALFIFAATMHLMNQGEFDKIIKLVEENKKLIDQLTLYPSIRFYILNQLAEAYLKSGKLESCLESLKFSERYARDFYANDRNSFFANLEILRAACSFSEKEKFEETEKAIQRSIETYEEVFHGTDKHLNQAFAYLMLGKLYSVQAKHNLAKQSFLKSEVIYEKLLKNKKIDDVGSLYGSLSKVGIALKDEALSHKYLKKLMNIFGLKNKHMQDLITYFDAQNLSLPI